MPTAPALFRVALEVSSPEKALAFYSELFGAPGRMVGGGRVYFDCGPVILALVDVSGQRKRLRPFPQHLYFAVADLEAFHERAAALGSLSKHEVHGEKGGVIGTRPWGERSFYAEDPFGNRLCFVDQKTLFTGERRG
ncbi:MAG TPA: VOC family protein [Thermoanaerobaculia bacterium]|jgi:catechol 2,3-dioxygenase-like lactoylglutathione lyase family enzyme